MNPDEYDKNYPPITPTTPTTPESKNFEEILVHREHIASSISGDLIETNETNNDTCNSKDINQSVNMSTSPTTNKFHFTTSSSSDCTKSNSFAYDISKDEILTGDISKDGGLTEQTYYSDGYFNSSLDKLYDRYMSLKPKNSSEEEEPTGCFDKTNETEDNSRFYHPFRNCNRKQMLIISTTMICMVVAATTATILTLNAVHHNTHHYHGETKNEEIAEMYTKAAVVTGSTVCTKIGADTLRKNGSAVDAAIAACFCLCVQAKHSTSLAAGGFMLAYKKINKEFDAYDFMSTAPGKSKRNMFDNNETTKTGGKYTATPGLVKGLYQTWREHGVLPWQELLQPAIDMSKNGINFQLRSQEIASQMKLQLEEDVGLRELLLSTNREPLPPGHIIYDEALAKTLSIIAKKPDDFYTGNLATEISREILKQGGLITLDDLSDYKVKKRDIISTTIDTLRVFTIGAPTGGPVITDILNMLKGYHFSEEDITSQDIFRTSATYHRLVEAMKFAFAHRTREGDPEYNDVDTMKEVKRVSYVDICDVLQEKGTSQDVNIKNQLMSNMSNEGIGEKYRQQIDDIETKDLLYYKPTYYLPTDEAGGSHISIIAPNGDAASMTTTINSWYGNMYRSPDTGIIYNNQLKTLSTMNHTDENHLLPSSINSIHAGKRPLTSIAPVILVDQKGNVRFVLGGSGGSKIIGAVTQVLINTLWFHEELGEALNHPRLFHDLFHKNITVETTFPQDIIEKLQARKHGVCKTTELEQSAVQAIYVDERGEIHAKSDPRQYGHTDGF